MNDALIPNGMTLYDESDYLGPDIYEGEEEDEEEQEEEITDAARELFFRFFKSRIGPDADCARA